LVKKLNEASGELWSSKKGDHPKKTVHSSEVRNAKRKLAVILALGFVSLFIIFIFSMSFGTISMPFGEAMSCVWNVIIKWGHPEGTNELVIYYLRMPRAISAILVGVGLSIAGVVMQALIRNPLVDPYITGVSSGAGFGATLVALAGFTIIDGVYSMPVAAFIGAIAAFFFTMVVAEAAGGRPMSYVLSGVIISIILSAGTTLLMVSNPDKLHGILFWLFGSFAYSTWDSTIIVFGVATVCCLIILFFANDFNVILLGDEQSKQLGLNPKGLKRVMIIFISILTAACVCFCGVIGFVGLIVPHVARMIVGGDHRLLLPASMMLGANVLLATDLICKTIAIPEELPVGAIIAIFGGPFFAYLMIRSGKEYAM
jgi:iron complex transport system permease protein